MPLTAGFGQTAPEYAIKATYIARFAGFIEWPEEAAENDASGDLVLSIIGDAAFIDIFERTFAALKIKDKRVEIRPISSVEESDGSKILFIASSEKKELERILAFTKDKPILTISDTEGFAREGVTINFYLERRKVRFEINSAALKDAGLRVSSLLLNSARLVEPKKGGK